MNHNNIEKAITNIDSKYVMEALDYKNKQHHNSGYFKTIGKVAACFALICILSVSGTLVAAAAGNETAFQVVYEMFPDIAMNLVPVNETCEDNGIKMSVEGINIEGDTADVYISLQDMSGNRIDETTDLFDSYDIRTGEDYQGDRMAGCSFVSYDEKSKKATFLLSITNMQGTPMSKDKVTFLLSKILTNKNEMSRELTEITNVDEVENTRDVGEVQLRGWASNGSDIEEFSDFFEKYRRDILCEDENIHFSPVDGATVTAYGFVNGKLHVQVHYDDILQHDNHGFITLVDDNSTIYPESIDFWDEEGVGSYTEYIFDITPEEMENYTVYGEFVTCDTLIEGDWSVTFSLTDR